MQLRGRFVPLESKSFPSYRSCSMSRRILRSDMILMFRQGGDQPKAFGPGHMLSPGMLTLLSGSQSVAEWSDRSLGFHLKLRLDELQPRELCQA